MNTLLSILIIPFFISSAVYSPDLNLSSYHQMDEPVTVNAIIFFSPSCPHCHQVISEVIPPLIEKFGDQLQIIGINTSTVEGQTLLMNAVERFNIPDERIAVPMLIVGETVLVGASEIPGLFPGIIENGLSSGGITWPDIPNLELMISDLQSDNPGNTPAPVEIEDLSIGERIKLDLTGNLIAIAVLIFLLLVVAWSVSNILRSISLNKFSFLRSPWITILLSVIGLVVAGYLSYIEITHSSATCGPIGDCNTVQQSPYASVFNILPIGIMGAAGYVLLFILSLIDVNRHTKAPPSMKYVSFGLALFGVFFSIYLTFLEPFVIGATCMWCITSAVIMAVILVSETVKLKAI